MPGSTPIIGQMMLIITCIEIILLKNVNVSCRPYVLALISDMLSVYTTLRPEGVICTHTFVKACYLCMVLGQRLAGATVLT